jgi:hypothetical protein
MLSEEALQALTDLAAVALDQSDVTSALEEICRIAVRTVPHAEGASVTTFSNGRAAARAHGPWAHTHDQQH